MNRPSAGAAMVLEGTRAAYGLWGLRRSSTLERVLGARNVLQGGASVLAMFGLPGVPGVPALVVRAEVVHGVGAGVDVLHAVSMLGLAAAAARHRRFALRSALGAAVLALGELSACFGAGRVGVRC